MAFPTFSMKQLFEAGVHYGHIARRWNPKMAPYLFGVRGGVHIINLDETVPMMHQGLKAIRDAVSKGGRVLFVGTKMQASEKMKEAAKKCGQHYINHRWLGGMLTNWKTVNQAIKRLKDMEQQLHSPAHMTKKEILQLHREQQKLERSIGGIREMGGLPDILFVVDINKESLAIQEAKKLGIPVVAIVDSNTDPELVDYPIPGNDDALRAISLYCDLVVEAVLDGLQAEMRSVGIDVGAAVGGPSMTSTEELAIA
jgi:small subunit ribosomal protein S2